MVNIRGLNRLKSCVNAKDEVSQINPIVIIPEALGLDDANQSTSDDCGKFQCQNRFLGGMCQASK